MNHCLRKSAGLVGKLAPAVATAGVLLQTPRSSSSNDDPLPTYSQSPANKVHTHLLSPEVVPVAIPGHTVTLEKLCGNYGQLHDSGKQLEAFATESGPLTKVNTRSSYPPPPDSSKENLVVAAKFAHAESLAADSLLVVPGKQPLADQYELQEPLGKGGCSTVFKVTETGSGIQRAVKRIQRSDLSSHRDVHEEVRILERLNSDPTFLQFIGLFQDEEHLDIVMELCSGNNMADWLDQEASLTEDTIRSLFTSMLETVHRCHAQGVLHLDIKPENFLVQADPQAKEAPLVRLIDFGNSRSVDEASKPLKTNFHSTPAYLAPEVLVSGKCTAAADAWSLGVTLYLLLYQRLPMACSFDHCAHAWLPPRGATASPEAQDLLKQMLTVDPSRRITLDAARSHPFLQKLRTSGLASAARTEAAH